MLIRREFKVPHEKNSNFKMEFFSFIASCIDEIGSQTGKWPDKMSFIGNIGKELLDIIEENEWDFSRFNPTHERSIVSKIIIEYQKPLTQCEDRDIITGKEGTIKGDSLTGQQMNGIPGPDTISKISNYGLSTNFTIERQIRPKLEVKLVR